MKLHIIAISQKQDPWVEDASNEYIKRFGIDYALVLKMIKPAKRKEGRKIASLLIEEEQKTVSYTHLTLPTSDLV